jgi:hypothetical protein
VKPKWTATDKITVTGVAEYAVWDYGATLTIPAYEYRTLSVGAGALWRPSPRFTFSAGYLHERRTASLPLSNYNDDVFTLEGRISF